MPRDFWRIYAPAMAFAVIGFAIAFMVMDPAPPSKVRFAAGAPGGAYHAYAEEYQRLLGEQGIEVELVNSAGSIENLQMLQEGAVEIALVQGALSGPEADAQLKSVGGMFEEPFWVFVRRDVTAADFGALRQRRLSIGPQGSGTRALAGVLQAAYGGDWPEAARQALPTQDAQAALLSGELDAAAFAASPDAPYVQSLLRNPSLRLLPFDRAPAIARREEGLSSVILLRGVIDVGGDIPSEDVPLVAAVAQLAVQDDVHPAIEAVLLDAALTIHGGGSVLSPAGRFPNLEGADLPVSKQVTRYYKDGPSFLRRYFSFGVANFLDRAWVLAIPLLTLAFPLVRAAPPIYRWRIRRKIYVWYKDLRELEARGRALPAGAPRDRLMTELEALQAEIGKVDVPLSYTDDLYRLRSHVEFVKQLLRPGSGAATLSV